MSRKPFASDISKNEQSKRGSEKQNNYRPFPNAGRAGTFQFVTPIKHCLPRYRLITIPWAFPIPNTAAAAAAACLSVLGVFAIIAGGEFAPHRHPECIQMHPYSHGHKQHPPWPPLTIVLFFALAVSLLVGLLCLENNPFHWFVPGAWQCRDAGAAAARQPPNARTAHEDGRLQRWQRSQTEPIGKMHGKWWSLVLRWRAFASSCWRKVGNGESSPRLKKMCASERAEEKHNPTNERTNTFN